MHVGMESEDVADALRILRTLRAVADNALDGTVPLSVARAYFDAAPRAPFFVALTARVA